MVSTWRPAANSVPQGSILRPVLFGIFVDGPVDGAVSTLSMFSDDPKLGDLDLGGVTDLPEGHAASRATLRGWRDGREAS